MAQGTSTSASIPTFSEEFDTLQWWNGKAGLDTRPGFAMASWADQGFAWSGASDTWYLQPADPAAVQLNPFSVKDGLLAISAGRSTTTYQDPKGSYEYTSGVLTTFHSFAQTYGYFEIRAEVSHTAGTLPAFWLMPVDGSWPPELDVMEIIGSDTSSLNTTAHSRVSGALKVGDRHFQTGTTTAIADASAAFHTYGVDWQADTITWYYDGVQVSQASTPADMNKPMYLIANLNVGGDWEGHPDSTRPFAADFTIDYIRAYHVKPVAIPMVKVPPESGAGTNWTIGKADTKDVLSGTAGNDVLNGMGGGDTMASGAGDDHYWINSTGDKVTEQVGQGTDTVHSWIVNYTLGANLENLIFEGSGGVKGNGNALANRITGQAGDDALDGKGGDDWLAGGEGNDTFVIASGEGRDTIADFQGGGIAGGDLLLLKGFGAGATLSHLGEDWTVQAADGNATHFMLRGVGYLGPADYLFS